jgi:hypothetical protein
MGDRLRSRSPRLGLACGRSDFRLCDSRREERQRRHGPRGQKIVRVLRRRENFMPVSFAGRGVSIRVVVVEQKMQPDPYGHRTGREPEGHHRGDQEMMKASQVREDSVRSRCQGQIPLMHSCVGVGLKKRGGAGEQWRRARRVVRCEAHAPGGRRIQPSRSFSPSVAARLPFFAQDDRICLRASGDTGQLVISA